MRHDDDHDRANKKNADGETMNRLSPVIVLGYFNLREGIVGVCYLGNKVGVSAALPVVSQHMYVYRS